MKKIKKVVGKLKIVGLCLLVTMVSSQPAMADDLDLYQKIFDAQDNLANGATDPNILFIMDTSGSMNDRLWVVTETTDAPDTGGGASSDYDPAQNYYPYGGSDQDFYFYHTAAASESELIEYTLRYEYYYEGEVSTIQKNQNVCAASKQYFSDNPGKPIFVDKLSQWKRKGSYGNNKKRWKWTNKRYDIQSRYNNKMVAECSQDFGNHGINDSSNKKYPLACFGNSGGAAYCNLGSNNKDPRYTNSPLTTSGYPFDSANTDGTLVPGNYYWYLVSKANDAYNNSGTGTGTGTSVTEPERGSVCYGTQTKVITRPSGATITYECMQKLKIMKSALDKLVNGDASDPASNGVKKVNIGLMRFNRSGSGGTLTQAVEPISTSKTEFNARVNEMRQGGSTPLSESFYEAYLYYTSGKSKSSRLYTNGYDYNYKLDRAAVDNITNKKFKSPLGVSACQGNYVILLSDGEPTSDSEYDSDIANIPGIGTCSGASAATNCLPNMSKVLKWKHGVRTFTIAFAANINVLKRAAQNGYDDYNEDGSKVAPDSTATPSDEEIGYYTANDLETLNTAFESIISAIQSVERDSFVAPAVTVNAFNRLQSKDDIYYALFKPDRLPRWVGNLKKYKVASDGTIVDSTTDSGGTPKNAIDPVTGYFVDDSKSFWSDVVDKNEVPKGGMAGELGTNRKLFASLGSNNQVNYLGASSNTANDGPVTMANQLKSTFGKDAGTILGVDFSLTGDFENQITSLNLSTEYNELTSVNTSGDFQVDNFLNISRWSLGEKIGTGTKTANQYVAESVHSTPIVISYGSSLTEPKDIVFLATNQGMLHAVAGQEPAEGGFSGKPGGSEMWSYIPDSSLFNNLGWYFNNKKKLNGVERSHTYGLDGPLVSDVKRKADGSIDYAKLYFGQRRGGNKYFAVDVTNADTATPSATSKPVAKLWTVEGGSGNLSRLAQTWAKPILTKVKTCNPSNSSCSNPYKDVLIVSGGYDPQYDQTKSMSDFSGNVLGNAIYLLDASDGSVLGVATDKPSSAGGLGANRSYLVSSMKHSIPSSPTVLDMDKDGAVDILFAVDIAGQVFRFDFKPGTGGSTLPKVSGGRIADLRETGKNRRFYNPLDATILPADSNGAPVRFALVTGSGFRANPTTKEQYGNRYFVLYDQFLKGPKTDTTNNPVYNYVEDSANSFSDIDINDLPELKTEYNVGSGSTADTIDAANTHKHGYYIKLKDQVSEKALNPTLIADFQVVAVTYKPNLGVNLSNKCSSAAGSSFAYQFDLLTGKAKQSTLAKPGISAQPVLLYLFEKDSNDEESLKPIVVIGPESFKGEKFGLKEPDLGKAKKRGWWEVKRRN